MAQTPYSPTHLSLKDEVLRLHGLAQGGDMKAAAILFDYYSPIFIQDVRKNLDPTVRRLHDSQDIVAQVEMLILHGKIRRHDVFGSPEQFIAYLSVVTRRWTRHVNRHFLKTAKENLTKDVAGQEFELLDRHNDDPAAAAAAQDCYQDFLDHLPTLDRYLLIWQRRGKPIAAMAALLGRPADWVKGKLAQLERDLEERLNPPPTFTQTQRTLTGRANPESAW